MRRFARDSSGVVDIWTGFAIFLIVAVPVALFVALFFYLRRTAPGGDVAQEPPKKGSGVEAEMADAPLRGARKCGRCGTAVRPQAGRGARICPNCGTMLAV